MPVVGIMSGAQFVKPVQPELAALSTLQELERTTLFPKYAWPPYTKICSDQEKSAGVKVTRIFHNRHKRYRTPENDVTSCPIYTLRCSRAF